VKHATDRIAAAVGEVPELRLLGRPDMNLLCFASDSVSVFHIADEMKVLAHEDVTLSGEYGRQILELKRGYSQILIDIVTAYEEELPDRLGHPTPEVAAFLLFGAMNWLYTRPRRLRNLPAEELAEAVALHTVEAIKKEFPEHNIMAEEYPYALPGSSSSAS